MGVFFCTSTGQERDSAPRTSRDEGACKNRARVGRFKEAPRVADGWIKFICKIKTGSSRRRACLKTGFNANLVDSHLHRGTTRQCAGAVESFTGWRPSCAE